MPQQNLPVEMLRKLFNDEIKVRQKKFLIQSRVFADLLEGTIREYQNGAKPLSCASCVLWLRLRVLCASVVNPASRLGGFA